MGIPHPAHPTDSPHSSIWLSEAATGGPRNRHQEVSLSHPPCVSAPKPVPETLLPNPRPEVPQAAWNDEERCCRTAAA